MPINNLWIDNLDDEEDLMCLDWHEYHEQDPYFVNKEEIKNIFKRQKKLNQEDMIKAIKLTENRYEITFNGDLLYFVCPLNARKEVKKDWNELKLIFEKYE